MDKKRNIFSIVFALISAVGIGLTAMVFLPESEPAYAQGITVQDPTLTAMVLSGVNGTNAVFAEKEYTLADGYKKDVTVTFDVSSSFYAFRYSVDGRETLGTRVFATPGDGKVSFIATETGRYELTCIAYADAYGETETDRSSTISFRNDVTAPYVKSAAAEEMNEWKRTGEPYSFYVDWRVFADDVSGLYERIFYYFDYRDGTRSAIGSTDTATSEKSLLSIEKAGDLVIVFYDVAGNGNVVRYTFDRFDDIAPPMPDYTVTPTPAQGAYSSRYEIAVTFLPDEGGSGLNDVQKYTIRRIAAQRTEQGTVSSVKKTIAFDAAPPTPEKIILDAQADYEITLYAVDKAGNRSLERVVTISFDAFDVTKPDMGDVVVSYNFEDAQGICSMSVQVSDREESGVRRVRLDKKDVVFTKESGTRYTARFDPFGYEASVTVVAEDNAGNATSRTIPFPYFEDVETSVSIQNACEAVRAMNKNEYTKTALSRIEAAEVSLGTLLLATSSRKSDLIQKANELLALTRETAHVTYVIETAPEYASGNVTFSASGFTSLKKGTEIVAELTEGKEVTGDLVKEAGFEKGFVDTFKLKFYLAETNEGNIGEGTIVVSMAMPVGYYDRRVALFDVDHGKQVGVEVKNNRIVFETNASTDFALVIEGGKATKKTEEVKTIVVFGHRLKLSVFLGVVCGSAGVAVAAIVAFIVIRKIRG